MSAASPSKGSTLTPQTPLTIAYKKLESGSPVLLDIYPPDVSQAKDVGHPPVQPAMVYFHGGGLTVGNRQSWLPQWLKERVTSSGIAFISADYRLIPPSTGHDVLQDVKDLFQFLASGFNDALRDAMVDHGLHDSVFQINPDAIAVSGSSGGGFPAYLSAMYATPKPKALVAIYAMGGSVLTPHYLTPKTTVFFRGREILDPQSFAEFLHPQSDKLPVTSDSALAYHPADAPIPGYPANPRMLLPRLYLQLGNFLDYYTGRHGLSATLRDKLSSIPPPMYHSDADPMMTPVLETSLVVDHVHIPEEVVPLFPQLGVTSSWPACFLIHGSIDSAVHAEESSHMHRLLKNAQVPVTLKIVPGCEHAFDYEKDAEETFGGEGGLFDEVKAFIVERLF